MVNFKTTSSSARHSTSFRLALLPCIEGHFTVEILLFRNRETTQGSKGKMLQSVQVRQQHV